jgi:RNA polymerase sigma-70 factor, ECF subfamily
VETAADLETAAPDPAVEAAPAGARGAEAELVRAARAGDVAAFERLYRATVGRVYGLCLRMTGNAALAEELTQDVFVRAWRRLATFRGESAFATWLTRLAVHVVVSERRTRRTRDARFQLAGDLEELAGAAPAARPGAALDLARAVAALPPQARRVFVLHDVEGWGHAEIAHRTGLAVGTCKAHLHRARRLLREVLAP